MFRIDLCYWCSTSGTPDRRDAGRSIHAVVRAVLRSVGPPYSHEKITILEIPINEDAVAVRKSYRGIQTRKAKFDCITAPGEQRSHILATYRTIVIDCS